MIAELVGGPVDGAKVLLDLAPLRVVVPVIPGPDLSYARRPLDELPGPVDVVRFEYEEVRS